MSDWIKRLAEEERKRIAAIKSFHAEVPAFMKLLLAAINSDLAKFEQEFPKEEVKAFLQFNRSDFIAITRSFDNSNSSAAIRTSPQRRVILCSYERFANAKNWEMQLELSNLGIHFPGRSPDSTVVELSRSILEPILFPDL